ncbi:SDR family oxidoreductase [Pseudofrankia inefficax]|uniref:Short-chain dehydrogenase/reductase SDR n=1 Tax=Pseudofrankia inefficax (strain DSM 45817 / CECT 9037 / DDB 130130 / EuI1c) TaxID=298654 RepID=E3J4B7_PSEI1|nr:SDR family oxidoreductase [Pseudofrankia inefficax]ADP83036.1 short-chain dehydrogenase/reductase SDR [Pseudofrankia inefficax]
MQVDLAGKVALVTGASQGIGAAIARAFAENGAKVMLSSRKREGLEKAAASIDGEVAIHPAHAGSPAAAEETVAAALATFGRLDILVNNAATSPYAGPLIDIDLPRFDKTVEVNLRAPLVWTQQAWRQWQSEHGGSVLNIASIGAMKYGGPIGAYDMTKAGLVHLTKHLATELGPRVRVNALAPGLVQTNFARYLWEGRGADPAEAAWPWPMARLGQPADIASAALWLSSEHAGWITGEVLVVDGGSLLGSGVTPAG